MMIVLVVLIFLFGIALGGFLQKRLFERALRIEKEKAEELKKNQFIEISKKVRSGKSKFRTRVNDMVYLSVNIEGHGDVDLIYLIDKDDIAIFQETKCLYTSDGIDKGLINEIISTIYKIYGKKINDVVEILGFTFYREEFEKSFNIKFEDLKKSNLFGNLINEIDEIDKIKNENKKKFNIDEILDKISAFGIASLSIEERLFLDNYSNEKGN
jgi:hypothetical protein